MRLFLTACFILTFIVLVKPVNARSGCCSWHGGVCGCGCCDGTPLSSTCAPYYPNCGGGYTYTSTYYSPPPPKPQVNCQSITARNTFTPNQDGTFEVLFDWDEVQSAQSYSIAIYDFAFGDPGPNIDTYTSQWRFYGVLPGKRHVAMKSGINGYWSNICDWTIEVPEWYPPPTITTTQQVNNVDYPDNNESRLPVYLGTGTLLSAVAYGIWKNNKKS